MKASFVIHQGIFVFIFENKRYPISYKEIRNILKKGKRNIIYSDNKNTSVIKVDSCPGGLCIEIEKYHFIISPSQLNENVGYVAGRGHLRNVMKEFVVLDENYKSKLRREELEKKYGSGLSLSELEYLNARDEQIHIEKIEKMQKDVDNEKEKRKTTIVEERQLLIDLFD